MASLFKGAYAVRQQYNDLTYTQVNAGTTQATAVLLGTLQNASRLAFIFNSIDQDLTIWLVNPLVATLNPQLPNNPAALADPTNRLFWMQMPKNFNLSFENGGVNMEFDPGTRVYVSLAPNGQTIGGIPQGTTTPATQGKIRLITWG